MLIAHIFTSLQRLSNYENYGNYGKCAFSFCKNNNTLYFQVIKTSGGYLLLKEMKKVEFTKSNLDLKLFHHKYFKGNDIGIGQLSMII